MPVSATLSITYWPERQAVERGHVFVVEVNVGRLDGQPAAVGHGVARVDDEVEERVLQLVGIGEGGPEPAALHGFHLDRLAERPAHDLRHAGDQAVHLQRLRLERLAPAEGEQAVGQLRRAVRALLRHADMAFERRRERFRPAVPGIAREPPLHHVEIADDDGEQVVEVVGDAAGELADRLHLLRLPELRLRLEASRAFRLQLGGALDHPPLQVLVEAGERVGRLAPLRHVDVDAEHPVGAAGIAKHLAPARQRAHRAVTREHAELRVEDALAAQRRLDLGRDAVPVVGVDGAGEATDGRLQLGLVDAPALEGAADEIDPVGADVPVPQADAAGLLRQAEPLLAGGERLRALAHARLQRVVGPLQLACLAPRRKRNEHCERCRRDERYGDDGEEPGPQSRGRGLSLQQQLSFLQIERLELRPELVHQPDAFLRPEEVGGKLVLLLLAQFDVAPAEIELGVDRRLQLRKPRLLARIVAGQRDQPREVGGDALDRGFVALQELAITGGEIAARPALGVLHGAEQVVRHLAHFVGVRHQPFHLGGAHRHDAGRQGGAKQQGEAGDEGERGPAALRRDIAVSVVGSFYLGHEASGWSAFDSSFVHGASRMPTGIPFLRRLVNAVVPLAGLEPARPCRQQILSLAQP